jgi:hypothetical protein
MDAPDTLLACRARGRVWLDELAAAGRPPLRFCYAPAPREQAIVGLENRRPRSLRVLLEADQAQQQHRQFQWLLKC